jgi:hypothetical protein
MFCILGSNTAFKISKEQPFNYCTIMNLPDINQDNINLTFKIMAPPVECPKRKHGKPGLPSESLLRNFFCN